MQCSPGTGCTGNNKININLSFVCFPIDMWFPFPFAFAAPPSPPLSLSIHLFNYWESLWKTRYHHSWLEWSHPFKICLFASFTWHWETSLILTFACCQRNWKPYTSYKPCHVPYIKSMPVKYYWGFRGCVLTPAHQHQAWFSANQRFISPSQWIFFPLNGYKMQTHKKSRLTHKKF